MQAGSSPTPGPTLDADAAHRERLAQAGRMLAGIVHEINNPLAVIQGYAQLLHERTQDADDRADIACILDEVRRLSTLVDDMLAFTRRGTEGVENVDLGQVVRAAINLTTHAMRQAGISVVARMPEQAVSVRGQHGSYMQVLLNLLGNARHSLEAAGTSQPGISIVVSPGGEGRTHLEVTNNGPPVPAHLAPTIFDPFVTTKSDGEGSGMGLALCRDILGRFEASIGLLDPGDPDGVRFRIDLPNA